MMETSGMNFFPPFFIPTYLGLRFSFLSHKLKECG